MHSRTNARQWLMRDKVMQEERSRVIVTTAIPIASMQSIGATTVTSSSLRGSAEHIGLAHSANAAAVEHHPNDFKSSGAGMRSSGKGRSSGGNEMMQKFVLSSSMPSTSSSSSHPYSHPPPPAAANLALMPSGGGGDILLPPVNVVSAFDALFDEEDNLYAAMDNFHDSQGFTDEGLNSVSDLYANNGDSDTSGTPQSDLRSSMEIPHQSLGNLDVHAASSRVSVGPGPHHHQNHPSVSHILLKSTASCPDQLAHEPGKSLLLRFLKPEDSHAVATSLLESTSLTVDTMNARFKRTNARSQMSNHPNTNRTDRHKKDIHNQVEKKRRGLINQNIDTLGLIVPMDFYKDGDKRSKGSILAATVNYVSYLKNNEQGNQMLFQEASLATEAISALLNRCKTFQQIFHQVGLGGSSSHEATQQCQDLLNRWTRLNQEYQLLLFKQQHSRGRSGTSQSSTVISCLDPSSISTSTAATTPGGLRLASPQDTRRPPGPSTTNTTTSTAASNSYWDSLKMEPCSISSNDMELGDNC